MKSLAKTMMVAGALVALSTPAFADNTMQRSGSADAPYGATSTYNTGSATIGATGTLSRSEIMDLQETLNERGYSVKEDGIWGSQTASTLRRFQRDNNLNATGTLNAETASFLDIELSSIEDDASASTTRANR